jgi:hypothetical protein
MRLLVLPKCSRANGPRLRQTGRVAQLDLHRRCCPTLLAVAADAGSWGEPDTCRPGRPGRSARWPPGPPSWPAFRLRACPRCPTRCCGSAPCSARWPVCRAGDPVAVPEAVRAGLHGRHGSIRHQSDTAGRRAARDDRRPALPIMTAYARRHTHFGRSACARTNRRMSAPRRLRTPSHSVGREPGPVWVDEGTD